MGTLHRTSAARLVATFAAAGSLGSLAALLAPAGPAETIAVSAVPAGATSPPPVPTAPGSATAAAAVSALLISFDTWSVGRPVAGNPPNLGDPDVRVSTVVRGGGDATVTAGRPGHGRAAELPGYDGAAAGPGALFTALDTDLSDGDLLSPGLQPFTFGADFRLDARSVGGDYDSGNNLVQRGLADSSDQYKLQVDQTTESVRPSCSVTEVTDASPSTASVASTVVVTADQWYRVRCTRAGSELRIAVTPYSADATAGPTVTTVRSGIAAIDLTWPTASPVVPLSIGGKVDPAGAIAARSDQFNGALDNVMLTVG